MGDTDSDEESSSMEIENHGHFHKLNRRVKKKDPTSSDEAWFAYDDTTGTECIWNTIFASRTDASTREKLLRRLEVLKLLKHPNIMQFMDYWVTEGEAREDGTRRVQITFITEVSTSGTLRRYLMKAKPRAQNPIKIIQRWCRQILSAMVKLHSVGITHGNLSLDTVFIQHNGLAKVGELCLGDLKNHIRTVAATPGVGPGGILNSTWAPELYDDHGFDELPPSIDIYAFGMLLLEMATSEVPYSECGSFKEIYDHVTAGIPPAALANVEHVELRAFIQTCLRKPANRPTAAELLEQPFLYEVPPLKVFVAYAILANEQLMTAAKTSLSPDDMNFLTEVSYGSWGVMANVLKRETRRVREKEVKKYWQTLGGVRHMQLYLALADGMRRVVTFACPPDQPVAPEVVGAELVDEGLLHPDDKPLIIALLRERPRPQHVHGADPPDLDTPDA